MDDQPIKRRLVLKPKVMRRSGGDIQLGLCCLNTALRDQGIFCSRKPTMKTIKDKGLPYLQSICLQNCQDLLKMLKWNADNGIRVFRISSELFPHKSNPRVQSYDLDFAQDLLTEAGIFARETGQRLTFHPGPYNIVGSRDTDNIIDYSSNGQLYQKDAIVRWNSILWRVKETHTTTADQVPPCDLETPILYERCTFQRTIDDLAWHAEVLDRLNCDQNSVMVVHGGALYNDKARTKARWVKNFTLLPEKVQRRLVLENCEKCFNIDDCLEISAKCGVPVVFDTHHYTCYSLLHPQEIFKPEKEYLPAILDTWHRRQIKPKFHVSEQAACCEGKKAKIGKHSDFIEALPEFLLTIEEPIDIMIEAKQKEQAIDRLYHVHADRFSRKRKIME